MPLPIDISPGSPGGPMKAVSFLSWEVEGTVVATKVDIIPTWTDVREGTISEEPVEDGSVLTHHAVARQPQLSVSATVSHTPLHSGTKAPLLRAVPSSRFSPQGLFLLTYYAQQGVAAAVDAAKDVIGLVADIPSGLETYQNHATGADPGNALHDLLIDAHANARLVSLSLSMDQNGNSSRTYTDYLIASVTKVVDVEAGQVSTFQIELTKPNIVKTESASFELPEALPSAPALALPSVKGKKPLNQREERTDNETSSQLKSTLSGFL